MSIEETTSRIMKILPSEQLRIEAVSYIRSQVRSLVLQHTATLQDKINDLDRQLYISNRKVENARSEEVDSAGFNK